MTTAQNDIEFDVAIIGYGPVGNALAILLTQFGRSTIVLERWPQAYGLPRAVHFDHEVGRILQSCGIGAELRAISEPAPLYEWRNAVGTTLLRFGSPGDGPAGWPASSMFNQPELEQLLEQRACAIGIDVRRGFDVTGLDQDGDRVVVTGANGEQVSARYVVGCDGANSTARALTGVPVTDLGFFYDWLIVDVVLNEPRVFDPINVQICDPARPTTAVSGGPGRRRWEFMRLPDEPVEAFNDEARAWELLAPWDVHPDNARLERHAVYTFSASFCDQWRDRRVLLAGDAAHLMPPFAGQGMCSGLRDAANLAWKLDLVLSGLADEPLLDSYQCERLPSVEAAIDFSVQLGQVICVPDPAEAAARDELMAAGVTDELAPAPGLPDISTGFVHPTAPHAGVQFVQGSVDGGAFDDVNGVGWRLVTTDDQSVEAGEAEWFTSIGGTVVPLADVDPTYQSWFDDHHCAWALQRPDFYLYGTAASAADATALLAALRHDLRPTTTLEGSTR